MDLGLQIAASGMVAEQARQSQLANDLANASTPGYKPDRTPQSSFGEVLLANAPGSAPVGSVVQGVSLGATVTDLQPGPVQETGEPLDFAIAGPGFFAVRAPEGVRYTRDGQFTTSAQGQLTDSAGNLVLSQAGAAISVPATGRLAAGALGVFEVPAAVKQGENLFSGASTGRAAGVVRQGALEGSAVDAAKVMVEMITSLRSFQSGQQAIQAIGQTLQQASTQVGSLGA